MALVLLVTGCTGSPFRPVESPDNSAVAPAASTHTLVNNRDSALLAVIDTLPDNQRTTFEGRTLEAGTPYTAASGSECRYVHFIESNGQTSAPRLACRNGEQPFFAADVFITPPGANR
jgi:hypothetical protein